jgi:hypothetical protein
MKVCVGSGSGEVGFGAQQLEDIAAISANTPHTARREASTV